jgi:hypothetical protein
MLHGVKWINRAGTIAELSLPIETLVCRIAEVSDYHRDGETCMWVGIFVW